jgi:predicted enzyme related to lactoylglutathione lyase
MADYKGKFVWYELMTSDIAAATRFYSDVVGWSAKDAGMSGMSYSLFSAGDIQVAGVMAIPDAARQGGMRPAWFGYIAVDDVDKSAEALKKAGGTVHREPADIPGVGRFAFVADPQGAMFYLFRGMSEAPPSPPMGTVGLGGWHELYAADLEPAFAFYAKLFGWTKGEAMDMGAMGVYQLFNKGSEMIGGMMKKLDSMPMPMWNYYFTVPEIDAAAARVKAGGGAVVNGPMDVPGGSRIIQCMDPQGAMFALVTPPTRS